MVMEEWVYLLHVDQQYLADMVRETLQAREIPVIVKSKGVGQVYIGSAGAGFDLHVPKGRLDEAQQLADTLFMEQGESEIDEEPEDIEEQEELLPTPDSTENGKIWWMLAVLGLAAILVLTLRKF